MTISVVRLGSPRAAHEGPRLGTVRRPPRGVKKQDYAKRDYYDVWLPDLAPSARLVKLALHGDSWKRFVREYRREMSQPPAQRLLDVLAKLSASADFSVGCYCEREETCHRSVLRELLKERGAKLK
jgi:uncharacterized protein YeaO (DUF488 family)